MQMLLKEQLISAATEAKEKNGYVGIINSAKGIKVVIKSLADYPKERDKLLADPHFIKGIQPDNILKYDYDNWKLQDCSIDYIIEQMNKNFVSKKTK
jgi:hypothetical protein